MPSASTLPAMAVASPQAGPSDNAVLSYVSSMIQQRVQLFATIEQFVIGEYQIISQEIAQAVYSFQQQVDRFFNIYPNPQNQSINTNAAQPSSDSGAGRGNSSGAGSGSGGVTSGHNAANQALNNATQPSGQGSGSGSSATTAYHNRSMKAQPMTSGTGTGSGSATVYGNVWLDSNYDGGIDNGELPYYGATVQLDRVGYGGYLSTTTDLDGNYKFTLPAPSIPPGYTWEVQVVFPFDFFATIPGYSQIDAQGFSQQFNLIAGNVVQVNAGIASMNVNTTADDPGNQKIQNKVTLRDAILTGNNGPPQPAITFYTAPNTPLNGTINLQAALDPIKTNYDVTGPGSATLAVSGANSFGVFTVNAGVTSTISDLTIEKGLAPNNGGGVLNQGNLTLSGDDLISNKATGNGGGLYNGGGGTVNISASEFYNNRASNGGGIFNANGGGGGATVRIKNGTTIDYNIVTGGGGGVDNSFGTVAVSGGSIYENISSGGVGGGIYTVKGHFSLTNVYLFSNFAKTFSGGGIYMRGGTAGGTMTISGGTLQGNTALNGNGGGIYLQAGSLTIKGGTLIGAYNGAIDGGGMYLANGTFTDFDGCTVSGNSASGNCEGVAYEQHAEWKIEIKGLTDTDDLAGLPCQV